MADSHGWQVGAGHWWEAMLSLEGTSAQAAEDPHDMASGFPQQANQERKSQVETILFMTYPQKLHSITSSLFLFTRSETPSVGHFQGEELAFTFLRE